MSKFRVFIICLLFLIVLGAIRVLWVQQLTTPDMLEAKQGVLDLRKSGIPSDHSAVLSGEWELYTEKLLISNNDERDSSLIQGLQPKYVMLPDDWLAFAAVDGQPVDAYRYAAYRLRVLLPDDKGKAYAMRFSSLGIATELFVNGRSVARSGQPAAEPASYTYGNTPYTATFFADQSELEIIIQVAADHPINIEGIDLLVYIGTPHTIQEQVRFNIGSQIAVVIILLSHLAYSAILYYLGIRQSSIIYFGVMMVFASLSVLTTDDRLLYAWIPMNYEWTMKSLEFAYLGSSLLLLDFIRRLLARHLNPSSLIRLLRVGYAYMLFNLLVPVQWLPALSLINLFVVLLPFLIVPALIVRVVLKSNRDAIFLLLGTLAIANNTVWGALKYTGIYWSTYYPVDMIVGIIIFASFWFRHYLRTAREAQELAAQLQAADKKKDDFLVNTSHELRNPLHGIMNLAQSALERSGDKLDQANRHNLELLMAIGRRMSFMLNDLIDLTRLKENRIRLHVRPLPLRGIVSGVIEMLGFLAQGKPIRFHNEIPAEFPLVAADEDRLIQILFNLLHNAVKYTDEGTITVRAEAYPDRAIIAVADTGIGIAADKLQLIFKPYEQVDAASASIGGGIGLGLGICKQLVELHGGAIMVHSVEGAGTTFSFSLPLCESEPVSGDASCELQTGHEQPIISPRTTRVPVLTTSSDDKPAERKVHSGTSIPSPRPHIIIVDDDPMNLVVLQHILPVEDYELTTVTNGKDALELLRAGEYDLLICDIMMPHMSGYELTEHVRAQFSLSELPILLLTARNRQSDIQRGFQVGANDYIIKPVDEIELRTRVQALTELRRSIRNQLHLEAAWLQAQIQPHFLFNTLNSISALSSINIEQMRELLDQFGTYLRTSFNFLNVARLVPLEHELELVRSYLFIEKTRFEDRLQVVWELESYSGLLIPPLTIQPLVENAVRHGIMKRARGGEIRIRIELHGNQAIVTVMDNGVGMSEEKLQTLLTKRSNQGTGVGLYNTDRRLKQLYGSGLQVVSAAGIGTTISFSLASLSQINEHRRP